MNLTRKKVPMRTCIGCGQSREKKELVRIVRTPDGTVVLDRTGRMSGRGCYLCNDPACFDKAVKKKSLNRALDVPVPETVVEEIRQALGAGGGHAG